MGKFPFYKQSDEMACGPTSLRMIARYYGKTLNLFDIISWSETTREGANLQGLSEAAEKIGFRTSAIKISYDKLSDAPLPCIAHWNQNHFVVVYKTKKNKTYVADPAHGLVSYTHEEFLKCWASEGENEGVLLLFETTPEFYSKDKTIHPHTEERHNFSSLFTYILRHKKAIVRLFICLLIGSLLQLIFPFLTQSIIDKGIKNKDLHFIYLILLAQLMVFLGRTTIDVIRNYILVHVSTRINISLTSDFFAKLMRLPISYFDTKMTGDIMQRITDNHRIENFLTGSSLNTLFSLLNFVVFSCVLAWYNLSIFLVFFLGSVIYFLWIVFFLKRRANLDFKRFQQSSQNQSKMIELINGMQEIKLHNAERQKRWEWEKLQAKLFKINLKGLSLTSVQNSGSALINELKNIFITFLSAKLVLDGQITLGMMLSTSYIIGQLNSPVMEMVNFIQTWQDAKLSLDRLGEIHNMADEESPDNENSNIESNCSFQINRLSFRYAGAGNDFVLNDLSVHIPANKITAIVGSSGSGKTTLMKLLLKFYKPTHGEIKLNQLNLNNISAHSWREKCGTVMQEGYIFNDTITNNIAVGVDVVNQQKLNHAIRIANIREFIENLPLGHNTKIGMEGVGLSTGQKQRILIARAVYKNPEYLFFDEATSALDANNEKVILENLNEFFSGKTVVVIAHRLSTVKNADQIIILEKGRIIEKGNHAELTAKKGAYYELVKNQLELGN